MKIFQIEPRQVNQKEFCELVLPSDSGWMNENIFCNEYEKVHELPVKYFDSVKICSQFL